MYKLLFSSIRINYQNAVNVLKRNGGALDFYCLWDEVDNSQDVDLCIGTVESLPEALDWLNAHEPALYIERAGNECLNVLLTWFTEQPFDDTDSYTSTFGVVLNAQGIPELE